MYRPLIINAMETERLTQGQYRFRLLTNITSEGIVKYLYVLEVSKGGEPCLYISSEVNAMAAELGGGSHFLCAFEGGKHLNFGCDDKWSDLKTFKEKAMEMAKERLKIK